MDSFAGSISPLLVLELSGDRWCSYCPCSRNKRNSTQATRMMLVAMCIPFSEMLYRAESNQVTVTSSEIARDHLEDFENWVNTYCPGADATIQ